jgi:hypothetical protein
MTRPITLLAYNVNCVILLSSMLSKACTDRAIEIPLIGRCRIGLERLCILYVHDPVSRVILVFVSKFPKLQYSLWLAPLHSLNRLLGLRYTQSIRCECDCWIVPCLFLFPILRSSEFRAMEMRNSEVMRKPIPNQLTQLNRFSPSTLLDTVIKLTH